MPSPDYPSPRAFVPPTVDRLVAATLRGVAMLHEREDYRRAERLEDYFLGRQYAGRSYGWGGEILSPSGAPSMGPPAFPPYMVPLRERQPPANWRAGKLVVGRLSALMFEGGFPTIEVHGDPDTQRFLRSVSRAANLPARIFHARNKGGSQGAVVLSYAWRDGLPLVEVHEWNDVTVLEWADRERRIPRVAVKCWRVREWGEDKEGALVELETWMAREWSGPRRLPDGTPAGVGAERVYRYHPADPSGPARWSLESEGALPECPLVWIDNADPEDSDASGEADFEGAETLVDEANLILSATSGGTARNADPTLVVKEDPSLNTGKTRKGGHNTIWSRGGAEYLQLKADGVKAGLDNFDKLRALLLELCDVTLMDPEKMTSAAQSGEALRRLLAPMLARAGRLRDRYGEGAIRVLQGLWRLALFVLATPTRRPVAAPDGKPAVDAAGAPQVEEVAQELRLPPDIEEAEDGDEPIVIQVVPGSGGEVVLVWHDMVPLSTEDKAKSVEMLTKANGGQPLIAPETAIAAAKAGVFPQIEDPETELEDIYESKERNVDIATAGMGVRTGGGPPGAPGSAKAPPRRPARPSAED